MKAHYEDEQVAVYHGDCIETMRDFPENSIDAIITDPPYGIRFMGEAWDGDDITSRQQRGKESSPMPEGVGGPNGGYRSAATEAGRYNRSIEASQAFQAWVTQWARECLRVLKPGGYMLAFGSPRMGGRLVCGIEDAGFEIRDTIAWIHAQGFPKSLDVRKAIIEKEGPEPFYVSADWHGWGTGLKPAFEPCVIARKPLDGTVAENVLFWSTGALNIDDCRVEMSTEDAAAINGKHAGMNAETYQRPAGHSLHLSTRPMPLQAAKAHEKGRWPTNVCLDDHAAALLNEQSGGQVEGGAARFFPTFRFAAKATAEERPEVDGVQHPTVKPLELMRWMVRLVAPHFATVLDPFAGSGTTLEACLREGVKCIGIEREEKYLPLIMQRLSKDIDQPLDFGEWSA